MKGVHLRIGGKVQGVFFRAFTRDLANSLGICGFVQNEPDGTVTVEAEGPAERIQSFIEGLRTGPPRAKVMTFALEEQPEKGYVGFELRR
jgi:acylphosphatase